ncbi:hypothetical protein TNCV_4531651 [Trichonephila clavipes]|nr:hypothetical protein TNCV_4531651 [Trichonephila clavipes]
MVVSCSVIHSDITLWRTLKALRVTHESSGRRDHASCRLSEHNCGTFTPLYDAYFPTGNGIFQQDSVPCQKARTVFKEKGPKSIKMNSN